MKAGFAIQVEDQACRMGLLWATTNSFENVLAYTDSEALISLLTAKSTTNISIHHTITDLRRLAASLKGCRIIKVPRDEVAIVHDLARQSRNKSFPFTTH